MRRKITKLFESRKGHLDYRIKRDFVREGIATIPCQISEYYDVICSYSVKGCESLNPEFEDYVKVITDMTPPDCPVVLNIICNNLSQDEKDIIEDTILDDFAYNLGLVEKEEKRHTQSFALMTIGLIISGILLWISNAMAEVPRELLYILFWFLGENLCDYIFLSGYDLRKERRLSGRLASVKVFFSENYEEPHYTKNDVDVLFSEIEKYFADIDALNDEKVAEFRKHHEETKSLIKYYYMDIPLDICAGLEAFEKEYCDNLLGTKWHDYLYSYYKDFRKKSNDEKKGSKEEFSKQTLSNFYDVMDYIFRDGFGTESKSAEEIKSGLLGMLFGEGE